MNLFSFFIVFAVSWWIFLFMLLPVGVKPVDEVETGHASSAPAKPMLLKKMAGATVLAAAFAAGFLFLSTHGYLDFVHIRER